MSVVLSASTRAGTAEGLMRGRRAERAGTTTTAWPVSPSASVIV